jgi:23S rRNA (cytosine1962-C5)-methyltransferase
MESSVDLFAVNSQVQVTQAGIRRIRRGHLWIYAGDVSREKVEGNPPIVQLTDGAGNVLGYAFYSRQSQIRLRLLSRDSEPPSREFFRTRILDSIARRRILFKNSTACRLVFGEGDLLPGIIIDRYGEYLVLQTLSKGGDALKSVLVDILNEVVRPAGILERNDVKARRLEGLEEVSGILSGTVPEEVIIQEGAARLAVNLVRGQKTGFFLDQSQNRIEAGKYASGKVLDCFTNTGAFALQFAPQCDSVLAVDISADSLAQARGNGELNGIRNIEFTEANVFDYLRDLESAGRLFDLINLDPPAFAKNRKAISGARSGYKEINLRALKLLRPDGILITSSCSYHMLENEFLDLICEAAQDAHRQIQIIERRSQASDHPVLAGMPETHYLKCFFLRAL